jgi:hypothetical protein
VKCWPLSHIKCKSVEKQRSQRIIKPRKRWQWDPIHQQVFGNVKAAIVKEVFQAYPDFSKPFKVYTDASTMQLGAVVAQNNRPIMFFSWKLSKMQQKYSIIKNELLAIVETLKEFKGILLG